MTADIRSFNAALAEKAGDNSLWTPLDCLEDAANDLRSGKKATSVLVITLDASDGGYDVRCQMANLKASECLALLEVAKAKALGWMGYIPEPP